MLYGRAECLGVSRVASTICRRAHLDFDNISSFSNTIFCLLRLIHVSQKAISALRISLATVRKRRGEERREKKKKEEEKREEKRREDEEEETLLSCRKI